MPRNTGPCRCPKAGSPVTTRSQGDRYVMTWRESGGPALTGSPQGAGFGSSLLALSVEGQLGGGLEQTWAREGLEVVADIPATALAPRRAAGQLT